MIDFNNLDSLDPTKIDYANLTPEEIDQMNDYLDGCTGHCESCGKGCDSQVTPRISRYCAALVGSKGGVGRSAMTVLLASALKRRGLTVGIIDADIATPATAHMLGASGIMPNNGEKVTPIQAPNGVKLVSMSLLGNDPNEPCLLGGKESASIAAFFWAGAIWENPDCVLIDVPGGIGDIPLELFTVLPIDETILVTNPGEICAAAARKTLTLCKMLLMPIRGVIENKSDAAADSLALLRSQELKLLARIPTDAALAQAADEGKLGDFFVPEIELLADAMASDIRKRRENS